MSKRYHDGQKTGKFCGYCGQPTEYKIYRMQRVVMERCSGWDILSTDHTFEYVASINLDDYNEYDRNTGEKK